MRISRINITEPDDLVSQAEQAGLNVSQLACPAAGAAELTRLAKVAEQLTPDRAGSAESR
jgi:post-segregation antitoxin (ccd killing protein)